MSRALIGKMHLAKKKKLLFTHVVLSSNMTFILTSSKKIAQLLQHFWHIKSKLHQLKNSQLFQFRSDAYFLTKSIWEGSYSFLFPRCNFVSREDNNVSPSCMPEWLWTSSRKWWRHRHGGEPFCFVPLHHVKSWKYIVMHWNTVEKAQASNLLFGRTGRATCVK